MKRVILVAILLLVTSPVANAGPLSGNAETVVPIAQAPPSANVFAQARDLNLSSAGIDEFIFPSVRGADRALAHELMAAMPAHLRGDFIALERNGHLCQQQPLYT